MRCRHVGFTRRANRLMFMAQQRAMSMRRLSPRDAKRNPQNLFCRWRCQACASIYAMQRYPAARFAQNDAEPTRVLPLFIAYACYMLILLFIRQRAER